MPKISIIVPVYNAEKYLSMTLNSILSQTFVDFELICVNDGSSDSSLDILNEFKQKDKRLVIINQDNQGVSASRNNGIAKSVGEYIVFFDADDLMHRTFLEKMYQTICSQNAEVAYCDYQNVSEDCKEIPLGKSKQYRIKSYDKPLDRYINGLICPHTMIWNKIYKAEYVKNTPFIIGLQTAEDKVFTYQLLSKIEKISYLKEALIFYRLSNSSITRSSFKVSHIYNHIEACKIMNSFFDGTSCLENKIRKKNLRMLTRQLIYRVYKKCPENVLFYWNELADYARFIFERKGFCFSELNFYHRFLMYLFLRKKFSTLLFILKILK